MSLLLLFFVVCGSVCVTSLTNFNPAVVVESLPNVPALDLESVLFVGREGERQALGRVFDVFGQVTQPLYVVRFNSPEHVIERKVQIGEEVFFAPSSEDHTRYCLLEELMR